MSRNRLAAVALLLAVTSGCADRGTTVRASAGGLPRVVESALRDVFPDAHVTRVGVDAEEGVTIYAIEFTDGPIEGGADIAADGTTLDSRATVDAGSVHRATMDAIRKAATGGSVRRIQREQVVARVRDGRIAPLPAPVHHFVVEIATKNGSREIVVGDCSRPGRPDD